MLRESFGADGISLSTSFIFRAFSCIPPHSPAPHSNKLGKFRTESMVGMMAEQIHNFHMTMYCVHTVAMPSVGYLRRDMREASGRPATADRNKQNSSRISFRSHRSPGS